MNFFLECFIRFFVLFRYHTLDISKSITDNLADKTLIEYPTIIVVLRKYWSEYITVGAGKYERQIYNRTQARDCR